MTKGYLLQCKVLPFTVQSVTFYYTKDYSLKFSTLPHNRILLEVKQKHYQKESVLLLFTQPSGMVSMDFRMPQHRKVCLVQQHFRHR